MKFSRVYSYILGTKLAIILKSTGETKCLHISKLKMISNLFISEGMLKLLISDRFRNENSSSSNVSNIYMHQVVHLSKLSGRFQVIGSAPVGVEGPAFRHSVSSNASKISEK